MHFHVSKVCIPSGGSRRAMRATSRGEESMRTPLRTALAAAALLASTVPLLAACDREKTLGEEIEEAGEELGDEIDDHTDDDD
jgi:hypothetical protein